MRGLRIRCDSSDRTRRPPGCVRLPACTIARSSLAPVSVPMFLTGLFPVTTGSVGPCASAQAAIQMSFTPRPLRGVAQSSLGELGPDSPFFEVGGGERPEHRTSSIDGYRAAELRSSQQDEWERGASAALSASELATDMRRREPGDLLDVLEPVALLDQAYRVLQRPAAPGGGHAAHLHRPPVSRRPPAPSTSHARILPAATLACVTSSPATWRAGRRLAASPPRRQMTAGATRVHLHHRANAGPAAGADRGAARDRQAGPRLCGDVSARTSGIDALAWAAPTRRASATGRRRRPTDTAPGAPQPPVGPNGISRRSYRTASELGYVRGAGVAGAFGGGPTRCPGTRLDVGEALGWRRSRRMPVAAPT